VVANAGILPMAFGKEFDPMHFVDATDVDLLGVMNTVAVSLPHLPTGASIIITYHAKDAARWLREDRA